ncbi:hypothetical protein [Microbacterium sp. BH-3-3-3]|uniref:hypothetical protein n=1 Tax=Microbacterium sp. BH-3-3-3 TaxID=1906742 RepID=UPI0011A3F110|nr:hypothetical protein [Microbacterium sp. BH-3-3-3]
MSGPHDRPDDPDEVTLWAGRLRAWPTPPAHDDAAAVEVDDDTVRVHAAGPEVEPDTEPDADTVLSGGARAADDTVVSTRDDDGIGTTAPRRAARPSAAAPDLDDETIRRPASPAVPDLDDATVRRAPAGVDRVDDETIRRPAPPALSDLDDQTIRRRAPAAATDLDEATRRRPGLESAGVDEDTRPRAAPARGDDDTAAGSRRSRREAASRPGPSEAPLPPVVSREAHVPTALRSDVYAPRTDGPVRVERALPVPRASASDASVVRPRSERRGTGRLVVLALVVVVIVAAAVVGGALLLG